MTPVVGVCLGGDWSIFIVEGPGMASSMLLGFLMLPSSGKPPTQYLHYDACSRHYNVTQGTWCHVIYRANRLGRLDGLVMLQL